MIRTLIAVGLATITTATTLPMDNVIQNGDIQNPQERVIIQSFDDFKNLVEDYQILLSGENEQEQDQDQQQEEEEDYKITLADQTRLPGWDGNVLNTYDGTVQGPSGKETYYNLPMEGVISIMRSLGYDEENYPYWVRNDGCKMLGPYIMCAANLNLRPKGTIIDCSLGKAMVCDTGTFASSNPTQLDIAVTW